MLNNRSQRILNASIEEWQGMDDAQKQISLNNVKRQIEIYEKAGPVKVFYDMDQLEAAKAFLKWIEI